MKKIFSFLMSLLACSVCMSAQEATLDLNLQKAIEIAIAENPTIKVADKEIELKKIADKEAWQALLPTVTADLALNHSITVAAIKTQMGEFKMGMDGTTTATGTATLRDNREEAIWLSETGTQTPCGCNRDGICQRPAHCGTLQPLV